MYIKQQIGKFGEQKACEYLVNNNYKILCKNFYCKQGEIDIIALSSDNELVFIEVKTRTNLKYGTPSESVTITKKRHIISAAKYYIFKNNISDFNIRFDIIEIYIGKFKCIINHIKQAF